MSSRPRDPRARPSVRQQATPVRPPAGGTSTRKATSTASGSSTAAPARARGRRRISPLWVVLAIAVVGSVVFSLYALTVRDERQVPMLAAGSLVVGLAFGAVAIAGAVTAVRAARAGRSGRAVGAALLGGVAALVSAGSLAIATVLAQIWGGTDTVV